MDTEAIRNYCLSLPHVTEDLKWQVDLCFSIGGKMFCVLDSSERFSCAFKVADEDFEALADSKDIIPAPYMARNKWIQVKSAARFHQSEWQEHLSGSYAMVKSKLTKKAQELLD